MQNGFYQAAGGMVTQLNKIDVISNNLANVNTIGYKQKDVVVSDFERIFQQTQDELPIENHTKNAASYLNRQINRVPRINEDYIDFTKGGLKYTGNNLDLAFKQSKLFFAVVDKDGEIKLTQNGSFTKDENGILVDKNGNRVLSSNYFNQPQDDAIVLNDNLDIVINENGEIYSDGEYLNSIFVGFVEDERELMKNGDNLYKINDLKKIKQNQNSGAIAQKMLESSNVNPITQMTSLIESHRLVEMYQKVMSSHMDELNNDAINKLASAK